MTGIYGWSYGSGGVHFHRVAEPLRVAAEHGIRAATGNRLDDEVCSEFDTILVHMLWNRRASEAWEKLAINGRHRMILDIDDAMWSPDWQPFKDHWTPKVLGRLRENAQLAHLVTTPSRRIAQYVMDEWGVLATYVPNTVPAYVLEMPAAPRGELVVGYQGSPSHEHDFTDDVVNALQVFLYGNHSWSLHVWGTDHVDRPAWIDPARIRNTPWQGGSRSKGIGWTDLRAYYASLSMDIGIGPLASTEFNRCKSALRAIEYAALGIPMVLSGGPAYDGYVLPEWGVLVEPWDRWLDVLDDLANDPMRRARMSAAGREAARAWTTEACITNWTEAWNSV